MGETEELGQQQKRSSMPGRHFARAHREGDRTPDPLMLGVSPSGLLRRADVHKHADSALFRLLSGFLSGKGGKGVGRLRSVRSRNKEDVLGYIPIPIFVGLSVLTLGLYPYVWFAQNARAFVILSLEKIEERSLRHYTVTGFFVQLLLFSSLVLAILGGVADSALLTEYAMRFAFFYFSLNMLVLLPVRSFLYFGLRWNLRRAVAAWDHTRIMIPRTMPSWWKLFIFGSLYIQFHINRVIGLGMPGFADAEDLREPLPFLEWLGGYLTGFNDPISKGRR